MKIKKLLYTITAILFWIAVWYIGAEKVNKSVLLPTPAETARVFISLCTDKSFWLICLTSVRNIFSGALCGVLAGFAIAGLSYVSGLLRRLLSPVMSLVKATPIASIIILLLVWVGKDKIPFWISLMMVTPIVASNIFEGLMNISKELLEVTKVYGFDFRKRWKLLYRPSLLPYLDSSLKSGIAMAWKAGIAAEVLCTPANTVGQMLNESKLYLETPQLFAWTLAVVLFSLVLEKTVLMLSRKIMGGVAK